jgi:hypothetical protein
LRAVSSSFESFPFFIEPNSLCLCKLEETWREDLDVIECVVIDHDLLDAVVIEVHREKNEGDT